ncbi:MAG TPA: hypothetical protein VK181_04540 [Rhizobium sp.]|nr:hypothetical protein [Rhizobium sp.]
MSSTAAFDAIHDQLTASWAETPLMFENDPLPALVDQETFVYVEIFGDQAMQDTFGDPGHNEWVEEGAAYLHVMVPDGTGSREARAIAGRLSLLFREVSLGTMQFTGISIGNGDPGQSFPNYFAMTVTLAWNRRDTI